MAEDLEEKIVESEEEVYESPDEDLGFEEEEEEDTSGELSWKQKLILINSGIIGFVFFICLIFPYEELARTYIYKFAQESNIVFEFRKLNLSMFSSKTIDHLIYQNKQDLEIRAESIEIDASIWDLIKSRFKGNISITSLNLEFKEFAIKANSVNLEDSTILDFDKDFGNINATIHLEIFNGTILRSPLIPIIDSLQGVTIKSILLSLKKTLNSNRILIEKGVFNLSIAKITVSGYIELAQPINASRIDLKFCPKLSDEYKIEREDIASSLEVMTQNLQDGCIPISGTIGDPKVNMPGLQQPPMTNTPVLSPIPSPNNPPAPPPVNNPVNPDSNDQNKINKNNESPEKKPEPAKIPKNPEPAKTPKNPESPKPSKSTEVNKNPNPPNPNPDADN